MPLEFTILSSFQLNRHVDQLLGLRNNVIISTLLVIPFQYHKYVEIKIKFRNRAVRSHFIYRMMVCSSESWDRKNHATRIHSDLDFFSV